MPNWLWKFIYGKSMIAGKMVYLDTNCYRDMARRYNKAELSKLIRKLKRKEKRRRIDVRLSYLVASEMFAHLSDPRAFNSHQECKLGLHAAIEHIGLDASKMLPGPDSEMHLFVEGSLPETEKILQQSLFDFLLALYRKSFDESVIDPNITQFQKTSQYIKNLKDSWIDSFINYFIQKHEPGFAGGWQLFAQDEQKRNKLLSEINAAEKSGEIFKEFGAGVCLYIINNFGLQGIIIDEPLVQKVINRFKPIFQLQLRIIKNICQSGYNLEKKENDIIDYLIMVSFDPTKTVFVSNESRHLVPTLHLFGYTSQVVSLNEYLRILGIKDRFRSN